MSGMIDLLNQLIEEAVKDGGDPGGAYHQNQDGLRKAIQDLLDHLALSNYEVVDKLGCSKWSRLSIEEKDAVEVVRCKDCTMWGTRVMSKDADGEFTGGDCLNFGQLTSPTFYCAWGDKKDE